jgi:hypothetical protein
MNTKLRQLLKALLIGLPILLLCLAIFRVVIAKADVVYPNPETDSAFLRDQSPPEMKPPLWLRYGEISSLD